MSTSGVLTEPSPADTSPEMAQVRRTVVFNVLWNWGGRLVQAGVGFIVMPLLIHRLGDATYALWTLLAAFTGYFGLFDLSLRSSVGRYMVYHLARQEMEQMNATLNTALAFIAGLSVAALAAIAVLQLAFFQLVDIPANQLAPARVALLII